MPACADLPQPPASCTQTCTLSNPAGRAASHAGRLQAQHLFPHPQQTSWPGTVSWKVGASWIWVLLWSAIEQDAPALLPCPLKEGRLGPLCNASASCHRTAWFFSSIGVLQGTHVAYVVLQNYLTMDELMDSGRTIGL